MIYDREVGENFEFARRTSKYRHLGERQMKVYQGIGVCEKCILWDVSGCI